MRKQYVLLLGLGYALSSRAGTALAKDMGFEIGGRLGYGVPLGEGDEGSDLDTLVAGTIPVWFDIGGRVTPELMIGGYLQLAPAIVSDDVSGCDTNGVDCSLVDIRIGAQLQYHLSPRSETDPWIGAGIGYEWLIFSASVDELDTSLTSTVHGFEFGMLQGGVDFKLGDSAALGPFFSFSIGQYDRANVSCDGAGCDADDEGSTEFEDKALHQWLVFGLRGTFVL
jgi:hypothetical protein